MKVICNATPLIHLSAIRQLELLHDLFGEIYIPEEVYHEVVLQGADRAGVIEVSNAKWIRRRRIVNRAALQTLETILGTVEAACVVLAMTMKADVVVIDDRIARLHAQAKGLRVTGTVGLLLIAAEKGRLEFERVLTELLATGFRLSPQEYERIVNVWRKQKDM